MPLRERQLLGSSRFSYPKGIKDLALHGVDRGHPRTRFAAVETNPMMLDALQLLERSLGREPGVGSAHARAGSPEIGVRDWGHPLATPEIGV